MAFPADLQRDELVDGRYRVVRRLGAGAMGVIYLAQHVTLRRQVALKVLRAEFVGDDDLAARFEAEARAASAIGHPHIVSVFDLGRCPDGSPYMAMEFLDGLALADHLAVVGALPWPKAVEITGQVLSALAAAHNHGIVHRDLKPENIFLVEQLPGIHHVKLLDFGISKVLANPGLKAERRATSHGTVMGTVEYMSPEQARGQTDLIDEGTDIYSTGVVLYEMLAGHPPFRGDSYNAVLSAILERRYAPLATVCPLVPWDLEVIVERALALDRKRRFATANEMRDALLAVDPGKEAARPEPAAALELVKLDRWAAGGPASVLVAPVAVAAGAVAAGPVSTSPASIELADLPPRKPPPVPRSQFREPPPPPLPVRRRGGQRALAYLSLVLLAVGGFGWLRLRSAPATTSGAEVTFEVQPASASLHLDGNAPSGGRASLAAGSSHTLAVTAQGFLAAEARFKAQPGRLGVRLVHALPSVDEIDVPALPAALPTAATTAPRSWDDVDRGVRRVEMLRDCLARARPSDCETLRNLARALADVPAAVDEAADAYLRALGDRVDGRASDVARAETALRQALWLERTRLDVDELALVATDGLGDDDWRARRLLIATRSPLGSAESRAAAVELATLLHRGSDAGLGGAADDLVAALTRHRKAAAAYSKLVELYDKRPIKSWPSPR